MKGRWTKSKSKGVITSYSIHYTKLYETYHVQIKLQRLTDKKLRNSIPNDTTIMKRRFRPFDGRFIARPEYAEKAKARTMICDGLKRAAQTNNIRSNFYEPIIGPKLPGRLLKESFRPTPKGGCVEEVLTPILSQEERQQLNFRTKKEGIIGAHLNPHEEETILMSPFLSYRNKEESYNFV